MLNKSVPTLLGIVVILLVVVLVVLVYNYKLTQALGEGGQVVGTTTTKLLTGAEPPKEQIGVEAVLGSRVPEVQAKPSPAMLFPKRVGERRARAERRLAIRREREEGAEGSAPGAPAPE